MKTEATGARGANSTSRRATRGSALVITMIVIILILGVVAAMNILTQSTIEEVNAQFSQVQALSATENGVALALKEVQATPFTWYDDGQSGGYWTGYVDSNAPSGQDYCTLSGVSGEMEYVTRVRSARMARTLGNRGGTYLYDADPNLVDVYEITTAVAPVGNRGNVRASQLFARLYDRIKEGVDTPLYIHQDEDPTFAGNAFTVSGADHAMPGGPVTTCATCGGTGFLPEDCKFCSGTGLDNKGDPCAKCGGSGTQPSSTDCPDCTGAAASATGQPEEADYFAADQTYAKDAVGYNGEYSDFVFNGSGDDQLYKYKVDPATGQPLTDANGDLVKIDGEDAYKEADVDLYDLAATYVGGQPEPGGITGATADHIVQPGDFTGGATLPIGSFTDTNQYSVTYVPVEDGKTLSLSGKVDGGGVMVIDGDVQITGQFAFSGIVIVLGDMKMTGGGSEIHIFGSILVESQSWVGGNADIWWCQEAVDAASKNRTSITVMAEKLAWRELVPDPTGTDTEWTFYQNWLQANGY